MEVLDRVAVLGVARHGGFINPEMSPPATPLANCAVSVLPDDFTGHPRYSEQLSFLPDVNGLVFLDASCPVVQYHGGAVCSPTAFEHDETSFAASLGWLFFSLRPNPGVDGFADGYPCSGLDLLSVRTLEELGGGANGNDCWGWVSCRPSASLCCLVAADAVHRGRHGCGESHLVDVFPRHAPAWRDVKVHNNHAFIVSEAANHGMQVVDLTQVLEVTEGPGAHARGELHRVWQRTQHRHQRGLVLRTRWEQNTAGGGLHAIDISTRAPSVGDQRRSLHPRRPGGACRRQTRTTQARKWRLLQRQRWGGHRGRDRQIGHGANPRSTTANRPTPTKGG